MTQSPNPHMKCHSTWRHVIIYFAFGFVLVSDPLYGVDCIYVGVAGPEAQDQGVAVVDAQSRTVVGRIAVRNGVAGNIAIDHARLRAYLIASKILVADLRTNTIQRTISLPSSMGRIERLLLSPDGSLLYALGFDLPTDSEVLVVIDLATDTISAPPIGLGNGFGPPFMDITPDGKFLYVARQPSPVSVVDTAAFTIAATVSGFPRGAFAYKLAVSPDGRWVYTIDPGNMVSVIDTATNSVADRIKITGCRRVHDVDHNCGSIGLAFSPDGRYVYIANAIDESIGVVDTATKAETVRERVRFGDPTLPGVLEAHPVFIAVSPDGNTLAVTHSQFDADIFAPNPMWNFIWVIQHGTAVRVAISQRSLPVFSDTALAIASVPSGCAGNLPAPSATPTSSSTPSDTRLLSATPSPSPQPSATTSVICSGDCNGDGSVTIDELLTMVNLALGSMQGCTAGDTNRDAKITIDEILAAVDKALNGCS